MALQALYSQAIPTALDPHETAMEIRGYFEHFKVPEEVREFAALLIAGTLQKQAELDPKIEAHTHNWRMSRMAVIDAWLLRMATYELAYCSDIDASVTIDEAIELAKSFGAAESPSFVNGVLDSLRTELGKK